MTLHAFPMLKVISSVFGNEISMPVFSTSRLSLFNLLCACCSIFASITKSSAYARWSFWATLLLQTLSNIKLNFCGQMTHPCLTPLPNLNLIFESSSREHFHLFAILGFWGGFQLRKLSEILSWFLYQPSQKLLQGQWRPSLTLL